MTQKILKYCILTLLVISVNINGQGITRTVSTGAENSAMSNSNISLAKNVSGMYLNPGSLAYLKNYSIFLNHSDFRHLQGMDENVSFPIFSNGQQTAALGLMLYHFGYVGVADTPKYGSQQLLEVGYNAAFATTIIPTVSAGILATIRNAKSGDQKTWAASYSIGINYVPSEDYSYGLVVRGIGADIQYLQKDSLDVLTLERNNMLACLEIGATMTFPTASSFRRKFFILSLSNEKIFSIRGLLYKIGVEVSPYEFLKLRMGYVAGTGINEPSFGLGFALGSVSINYSVYTHKSSTIYDQFSLSIGL